MCVGFFQANQIVGGGVFDGRNRVFADVDAQYATEFAFFDVAYHGVDTVVIETHAVNDALVFGNAKEARLRVAGLRFGRYRADFDETEAERGQSIYVFAVFIEPCGKSDRVGQIHAHQPDRFGSLVVGYRNQAELINRVEGIECEMVCLFGIKRK